MEREKKIGRLGEKSQVCLGGNTKQHKLVELRMYIVVVRGGGVGWEKAAASRESCGKTEQLQAEGRSERSTSNLGLARATSVYLIKS